MAELGATAGGRGLRALTVPACVVCAGSPLVLGPLAGLPVAMIIAGEAVHSLLLPMIPFNLLVLVRGRRVHGRRAGLVIGGLGLLLISMHVAGHFGAFDWLVGDTHLTSTDPDTLFPRRWVIGMVPIWVGSVLLAVGSVIDLRARWEARSIVLGAGSAEGYWDAVLTGRHAGLREGRAAFLRVPSPPRCRLCAAPFGGVGGMLMRLVGRRPARSNPHFCTSCLAKTPVGGVEVDLVVLTADVRGSTALGEQLTPTVFATRMARFHRLATDAITDAGGLVSGFAGDGVMAFFAPGFAGDAAGDAAITASETLLRSAAVDDPPIAVGVGVHRGRCFAGLMEADAGRTDLNAWGDVVNVAARLGSMAQAGTALISTAALADSRLADLATEPLQLKGRTDPVSAAVIDGAVRVPILPEPAAAR